MRPSGGAADLRPAAPAFVAIDELLPPAFVRRHSGFRDVHHLLAAGQLDPASLVDPDTSTQRRCDDFMRLSTAFPSWAALLREARGEWIMRRLGLVLDA